MENGRLRSHEMAMNLFSSDIAMRLFFFFGVKAHSQTLAKFSAILKGMPDQVLYYWSFTVFQTLQLSVIRGP